MMLLVRDVGNEGGAGGTGGSGGLTLGFVNVGSGKVLGMLIGTGPVGGSSIFGTDDCALKNSSFSPGKNELIRSQVTCQRGKYPSELVKI